MSIETAEELAGMRRAGRVVAETLAELRRRVRPGVTTAELDGHAGAVFRRHGARSAPNLAYGFPGHTCISVNDEAVHGIPGRRRLRPGDLVTLDVTAELDGFMADAAVTVPVGGKATGSALRLAATARHALREGIAAASAGAPVSAIGRAVEGRVRSEGFCVLRDLHGHGIGRSIHEEPSVPQWEAPGYDAPLTPGLVITIEPIITPSTSRCYGANDGWTVLTADGSWSAHFEHTIVIGQPGQAAEVLTAA